MLRKPKASSQKPSPTGGAIEYGETCQNHVFRLSAGATLGRCYARIGDFERSIGTLKENEIIGRATGEGIRIMTTGEFFKTYLTMVEQSSEGKEERYISEKKEGWQKSPTSAKVVRILFRAIALRGTYEWIRGKPIRQNSGG